MLCNAIGYKYGLPCLNRTNYFLHCLPVIRPIEGYISTPFLLLIPVIILACLFSKQNISSLLSYGAGQILCWINNDSLSRSMALIQCFFIPHPIMPVLTMCLPVRVKIKWHMAVKNFTICTHNSLKVMYTIQKYFFLYERLLFKSFFFTGWESCLREHLRGTYLSGLHIRQLTGYLS